MEDNLVINNITSEQKVETPKNKTADMRNYMKTYMKEYSKNNKDKINKMEKCAHCNVEYYKRNRLVHLNSNKHQLIVLKKELQSLKVQEN